MCVKIASTQKIYRASRTSKIPKLMNTWSKYGKVLLHLGRVQRSNAEYHHTPSLAHASFFDDVIAVLLAP
jgi:hypothetical protein